MRMFSSKIDLIPRIIHMQQGEVGMEASLEPTSFEFEL